MSTADSSNTAGSRSSAPASSADRPDAGHGAGDRPTVAVIGAGIIGATAALDLQRQGFAVVLLDRGEPGMGCSYGNGGAISPDLCVPSALPGLIKRVPRWLGDPLGPLVIRWRRLPAVLPWLLRWVRASDPARVERAAAALRALHAPSLRAYHEILGSDGARLIETTGQLYVWRSDQASPTELLARALRERHGVETRTLDEAAIRAIDPELAPGFRMGLFFPDNGHTVNPLRLVQTLIEQFRRDGGRVERAEVTALEPAGSGIGSAVCRDGRRIAAQHYVVATGIDGTRLASALGDRVPLEAERGYHMMLPNPGVRPVVKISNRDHMFGLTPMENGVRIAGTVEFASPGTPPDERRAQALLTQAKRMYPRLDVTGATSWMGSRPSTPDSLPVIDRARRAGNVVYAFGHGHSGLTGAPMTAAIVTELLGGRKAPLDRTPYRLDRF
ncbi:MAG: NAD(P)/FAD-dependent oxidoreductase [Lautropia sp.]